VAKKKAPEPKKRPSYRTKNQLVVRGTDEWGAWVAELAEHCRIAQVQVVDAALIQYAKKVGFTKPAPKRTEGKP
jgi:hypothetical protein